MSLKRSVDELIDSERKPKQIKLADVNVKKHTLDSDEEDETEEQYNILDENDIEGEEDGAARQDGEQRMTAFNMQEEMEMGHFDKDGHFIWKNEKEVRDNWLDNIDWHKIKDKDKAEGVLELAADDSDEEIVPKHFDEIETYRKIIVYMKPKESITKTLRRLAGDSTKLSSVERLRRKKAGTLSSSEEVTELTELANEILTEMGNMDVYQETYEYIRLKLDNHTKKSKSSAKIVEAELDMYADDFDNQEKHKLDGTEQHEEEAAAPEEPKTKELMWEFKRDQNKEDVEGPFSTQQMNKWSAEGHFKTGVWVRKCWGEDSNFYSSNRIDFELYL